MVILKRPSCQQPKLAKHHAEAYGLWTELARDNELGDVAPPITESPYVGQDTIESVSPKETHPQDLCTDTMFPGVAELSGLEGGKKRKLETKIRKRK